MSAGNGGEFQLHVVGSSSPQHYCEEGVVAAARSARESTFTNA